MQLIRTTVENESLGIQTHNAKLHVLTDDDLEKILDVVNKEKEILIVHGESMTLLHQVIVEMISLVKELNLRIKQLESDHGYTH